MRYLNKTCFLIDEVIKTIDLTKNTIQNLFFKQIKNITLNEENNMQQFPEAI
jgi:hypothetical protein